MSTTKIHDVASILKSVVRLAVFFAAVYFLVRCIDSRSGDEEITLKPTPVVIEDVKPIGELYAMTAITEDYDVYFMEDPGIFSNDYPSTIQTLRMQVSFVMNLDSVRYEEVEGSDTVIVHLPRLRFVKAGNGGQLLGGVEKADYNAASQRIDIVENKIVLKYNTPENYQKAMEHAKEVLGQFVSQCGRVPKFVELQPQKE